MGFPPGGQDYDDQVYNYDGSHDDDELDQH